jgi:hypothetical protein
MSPEMKVRLGHPIVIFIHSVALLLLGCAIGMHWHQSRSTAIWMAVSGAVLIVINEMISALILFYFTALWMRREKRARGANGHV